MNTSRLVNDVLVSVAVGIVALTGACSDSKPSASRDDKKTEERAPVVDAVELAGSSKVQAVELLGSEPSCEDAEVPGHGPGIRCKWTNPSVEALFFEDKLRRADITAPGIQFKPESGVVYGITSKPTLKNNNVIRWDIGGYEASIFPDGKGDVSYFYLSDGG